MESAAGMNHEPQVPMTEVAPVADPAGSEA